MWTTEEPIWERDGRDWPNREASRFVKAAGLRWHVQVAGEGPVILLVHGTGVVGPLVSRSHPVALAAVSPSLRRTCPATGSPIVRRFASFRLRA